MMKETPASYRGNKARAEHNTHTDTIQTFWYFFVVVGGAITQFCFLCLTEDFQTGIGRRIPWYFSCSWDQIWELLKNYQCFWPPLQGWYWDGSENAIREGVRSVSSLSPERRQNSWRLYFNPSHQYLITRVYLGPIAFRICITLLCVKCIL